MALRDGGGEPRKLDGAGNPKPAELRTASSTSANVVRGEPAVVEQGEVAAHGGRVEPGAVRSDRPGEAEAVAPGPEAAQTTGTAGRVRSGVHERVSALWEREAPDPAWTRETEEYVTETAKAVSATLSIVEPIDCRQTVCRLVIEFGGEEDLVKMAGAVWSRQRLVFPVPGNPDQTRIEIFTPRAGSRFDRLLNGEERLPPDW